MRVAVQPLLLALAVCLAAAGPAAAELLRPFKDELFA